ncbi:MAG: thioredoxin family protein [Pirellulales bacterium]|nr:thioredoxin family protein [Pirellulales bacterium]
MTTFILTAMVQIAVFGADPQDFNQACQQSMATRRPLVVLVGANWCGACQTMHNSIIPQVERTGGLKNVVFLYVDFDQQRQLASRLTGGGSIPQLIRFDHTQAGWTNKRLIGARSPGEVYGFINAGLIDISRQSPLNVQETSRQSTPPAGPILKKAEVSRTPTVVERNEAARAAQPRSHSQASASEKAATPAASRPWVASPVNPPVGQQRAVEPSRNTAKPQTPSERAPFFKRLLQGFKKLFQKSENHR